MSDFEALPGNGLTARLGSDLLRGGNQVFISRSADVPDNMTGYADSLAEAGKTPLFFTKGDKFLGVIAVADVIKEDSPQAVRELRGMGIHCLLYTSARISLSRIGANWRYRTARHDRRPGARYGRISRP